MVVMANYITASVRRPQLDRKLLKFYAF
uniref:Uncharacterized protein n=1 Tax=Anguilla anguilla TaxID=7936 RepID=A0A0E9SJN6_ANGAN